MTRVLNLYGGPGTGKSTTAALVFGALKQQGINAEIAHEYAKDLVWEHRQHTLTFQEYVAAKQIHRVQRLMGQVDVIVTDSPILFSLIYSEAPEQFVERAPNGEGSKLNPEYVRFSFWRDYLKSVHRAWDTVDVFLERDPTRPYSEVGRNQTEEEAREIDGRILTLLRQYCPQVHPHLAYHTVRVDKDRDLHVDEILRLL